MNTLSPEHIAVTAEQDHDVIYSQLGSLAMGEERTDRLQLVRPYTPEDMSRPDRDGKRSVRLEFTNDTATTIDVYTYGPWDRINDPKNPAWPVVHWSGTPSSAKGQTALSNGELDFTDIAWCGIQKPGYGGSERLPGRIIADGATILEGVAGALGLSHCSVVGRSGGAPYAEACYAELPNLVVNGAFFNSMAPKGLVAAQGVYDGWSKDFTEQNERAYNAKTPEQWLEQALAFRRQSRELEDDMFIVIEDAIKNACSADQKLMRGWTRRRLGVAESHVHALQGEGYWGRFDDVVAQAQYDWGFYVGKARRPGLFVQGDVDKITPGHHLWSLVAPISPNLVTTAVIGGEGHFYTLDMVRGVVFGLTLNGRRTVYEGEQRSLRQDMVPFFRGWQDDYNTRPTIRFRDRTGSHDAHLVAM